MLPLDMASKRPSWDPDLIRARMVAARKNKGLSVKEAAGLAGMSDWSWYKKEGGGVAFSPQECDRFADAVGAPTLFPLYDWAHAEELDRRLGWK
jgi:hypothetical protein